MDYTEIRVTSGEKLKKDLGLSKVNARISRIINYPQKLYYIWYDSARPTIVLHWARVVSDKKVSTMRNGSGDALKIAPLLDLEDFNGDYKNTYFILVDLAGQRQINTRVLESVTLDDLKGAASSMTKDFRSDRNKSTGTENRLSKLLQVNYQGGNLRFTWLTSPTNDSGVEKSKDPKSPNRDIYNANPSDGKLTLDPSKTYEMEIEIIDFDQWLDTYPKGYEIKPQDFRDIFDVAYVKVWSNSPSFWWQGMCFRLTKTDGAIYPCDIPDNQWKNFHGVGALLDKHLLGLVNNIGFYFTAMSHMTNTYLKSKGLL